MNNSVKPRRRKGTRTVVSSEAVQTTGLDSQYLGQRLKHQKDTPASVGDKRKDRVVHDLSLHRIQIMDTLELGKLQDILEHGTTFGRWQTPLKWAGGLQPSMQDISLRKRIVYHLEERHKIIVQDADDVLSRMEQEANGKIFDFGTCQKFCVRGQNS